MGFAVQEGGRGHVVHPRSSVDVVEVLRTEAPCDAAHVVLLARMGESGEIRNLRTVPQTVWRVPGRGDSSSFGRVASDAPRGKRG